VIADGVPNEGREAIQVELFRDCRAMVLDGFRGDPQGRREILVALAFGGQ